MTFPPAPTKFFSIIPLASNSLTTLINSTYGAETRPHKIAFALCFHPLARTARGEGVVIVTDNTGDFEKIRPLCAVKTVRGEDYFGTAPD